MPRRLVSPLLFAASMALALAALVVLRNPANIISDWMRITDGISRKPDTGGYALGVLVWSLLLSVYPVVAFIRGPLARWRWVRAGRCVRCGYNLTGLPAPRCPECGEPFGTWGNTFHWFWGKMRPGLRVILAATTVFVVSVTITLSIIWEYLPGTLRFDEMIGFPHGTGTAVYHYRSGELKLREKYFAGELQESAWYRPDGSQVASTRWQDGTGVGYYLREDGTILKRVECVNGAAHGVATYYNRDGTINCEVRYERGAMIEGKPPKWDEP